MNRSGIDLFLALVLVQSLAHAEDYRKVLTADLSCVDGLQLYSSSDPGDDDYNLLRILPNNGPESGRFFGPGQEWRERGLAFPGNYDGKNGAFYVDRGQSPGQKAPTVYFIPGTPGKTIGGKLVVKGQPNMIAAAEFGSDGMLSSMQYSTDDSGTKRIDPKGTLNATKVVGDAPNAWLQKYVLSTLKRYQDLRHGMWERSYLVSTEHYSSNNAGQQKRASKVYAALKKCAQAFPGSKEINSLVGTIINENHLDAAAEAKAAKQAEADERRVIDDIRKQSQQLLEKMKESQPDTSEPGHSTDSPEMSPR